MDIDKFSRELTILKVVGTAALILIILMSIAGAASYEHVTNSSNKDVSTSNKSDETIKPFDKAIETNSQNSTFWKNKGNALYDLNKYDEAIKAYDKAIEINPQDSNAWYNKGNALSRLNESDEAIKAYDKAIEINPQNSDAWIIKDLLYLI